jgi:hypothetical protein
VWDLVKIVITGTLGFAVVGDFRAWGSAWRTMKVEEPGMRAAVHDFANDALLAGVPGLCPSAAGRLAATDQDQFAPSRLVTPIRERHDIHVAAAWTRTLRGNGRSVFSGAYSARTLRV